LVVEADSPAGEITRAGALTLPNSLSPRRRQPVHRQRRTQPFSGQAREVSADPREHFV